MKIKSDSKDRPSILLWLVGYITFFIFPLAMFLDMIMVKIGLKDDGMTFFAATIAAILICRWHGSLDTEVSEYLIKKYGKDV